MKLSPYILILLILLNICSFAQKESYIWYFGKHAGLNFNTNPPTVLTNGALNQQEGSSSVCNQYGQLLFYTDGMTVWNKNHIAMPNGTGLDGDYHSTYSGFIVKKPGSSDIYYVFTASSAFSGSELRYSIVDMSLNGTLGDVTSKNVLLRNNMTEKISAVADNNNQNIWLVAHERNSTNYIKYLISNSGISPVIIQSIGSISNTEPGSLKFSHCGDKLANANPVSNSLDLFNFDRSTGIISNPQLIYFPGGVFWLEFSLSGEYLYLAVGHPTSLYQLKVSTGLYSLIASPTFELGQMQLAPDGKIYIAEYYYPAPETYNPSNYLGVINNPESQGALCNYVALGVYLNINGNTQSLRGIPSFIASLVKPPVNLGNDATICQNDSIILSPGSGFLSYLWQDGSTDSAFTAKLPGIYWCRVTILCDTLSDTVIITQGPQPNIYLGPDTSICAGSSITFHAGGGYNSYHWQNGSTDSVFTANAVGVYSVTVTDNCGSDADTVSLNIYPQPQPDLGNDSTVCTSISMTLDAGSGYSSYHWQNGATNQTFPVNTPGIYSVTVTNSHNCSGTDTIIFYQGNIPSITLGENRDLCQSNSFVLDPGVGYNTYLWQNGSTDQTYTAISEGIYSVTVTNDCGFDSASVTVSECPECICNIPNAFTPNYDGENDVLFVKGKGFTELEFTIFNRLGEQVFISNTIENGWDGKWLGIKQKNETYIYIIKAICLNGEKIYLKGNVTLLR